MGLAQQKPDFTGVWKMNLDKSTFDKQGPPPGPVVLTVEHKDPVLTEKVTHYTADQKAQEMGALKYVTDGSEGSNAVMGNPLKYTAKWTGSTLVVETWGKFGQNEMRLTDKWSLSDDGKTVTILRHYEGNGGPQDQKLLFEKRPAKSN